MQLNYERLRIGNRHSDRFPTHCRAIKDESFVVICDRANRLSGQSAVYHVIFDSLFEPCGKIDFQTISEYNLAL